MENLQNTNECISLFMGTNILKKFYTMNFKAKLQPTLRPSNVNGQEDPGFK